VAVGGDRAAAFDFAAVQVASEGAGRGGLAQTGERVDGDRAFDPVAVLTVRIDDVPQVLVDRGELLGAHGEVGVPNRALLGVGVAGGFVECFELPAGQLVGLDPWLRLGELLPAVFA